MGCPRPATNDELQPQVRKRQPPKTTPGYAPLRGATLRARVECRILHARQASPARHRIDCFPPMGARSYRH
jgi:hypothetical protein